VANPFGEGRQAVVLVEIGRGRLARPALGGGGASGRAGGSRAAGGASAGFPVTTRRVGRALSGGAAFNYNFAFAVFAFLFGGRFQGEGIGGLFVGRLSGSFGRTRIDNDIIRFGDKRAKSGGSWTRFWDGLIRRFVFGGSRFFSRHSVGSAFSNFFRNCSLLYLINLKASSHQLLVLLKEVLTIDSAFQILLMT
jgi:hypothetical protein